MNIDITKLKSGIENQISIDFNYSFSEEQLKKTTIESLNDVRVKGYLSRSNTDSYELDVSISGMMVLPCSVTLEPVKYYFETSVDGNVDDLLKEINESSKKTQNTIDILPIIWENILMEIPIRVVSEKASNKTLKGDGWKLVTEEQENLNPELQKLKDLLK